MNISKKDFQIYENIRDSGEFNICDIKTIMVLTNLSKEKILYIMRNYNELFSKYTDKVKSVIIDVHKNNKITIMINNKYITVNKEDKICL